MTEKRKYHRIIVEGKIDGKLVLATEIEIIDLSIGGVHFTCTKRVMTNSICTIHLRHKNKVTGLRGKVVRSIFKGTKKIKTESVPVYEVAMEFSDLPENKAVILKQILESFDT